MAAIVAMAAILGALLIFTAPSAHAKQTVTNGKCSDNTGLNVVVDFQDLGGGVKIRCVENWSSGTALAAIDAALDIQGTQRWGKAFICRIDGKPGPADEPCIDTPPASAYWSYWVADSGSWRYSQKGVGNMTANPGEWHGLSFSMNRTETTNPPPRTTPAVPSAPKPKPKPSPKPTSTSKPKPTAKPSESSKPKPSSSGTSSSKPGSSSASTTSPSPSGSKPSAPGSSDSTPSPSDSAAPDPDAKEDSAATPDDPADDAQASESTDPDSEETGAAAEADSGADDADTSANVQDSSAQHTSSENADSSPPVGTLIVGGVIVLLVGAGIFRHRTGKKLEGN